MSFLTEMLYGIKNFHSVFLANVKEGLGYHYPLCCIIEYSFHTQLNYLMPFNLRVLLLKKRSKFMRRALKKFKTVQIPCYLHRHGVV